MLLALAVLFVGWVCFVFAAVNIIVLAHKYALGKPGSYGLKGTLKGLIFSATLAFWYFLVFYQFPELIK